jgi:hypothetical protein
MLGVLSGSHACSGRLYAVMSKKSGSLQKQGKGTGRDRSQRAKLMVYLSAF